MVRDKLGRLRQDAVWRVAAKELEVDERGEKFGRTLKAIAKHKPRLKERS
jgi:hypothetical protein